MLKNARSVSPTLGLILMIAITFVLAVALFKALNVHFYNVPNAVINIELYTVKNANATKIVIKDLGGDPIYFKKEQIFIYLNKHKYNFCPFTKHGYLKAGDVGVMVVPFPSKVGQTVEVKLAIGGMSLFSGEWATVFYSKKVTVQKSRVLSVENGLLAEWHFEHKYPNETAFIKGNSSAKIPRFYDLSGRGNHLIYGAYDSWDSDTMWVKGVNGLALNFKPNGSAYGAFCSVDHIMNNINLTKSLTYEMWIKPRDFSNLGTIITDGAWYRWIFVSNDGWWGGSRKVVACFCFNGESSSGTEKYIISTTSLERDKWYHITVTYDGKFVRIYINGKLDKEEYHPGYITPAPEHDAVFIGSQWGDYSFNGIIDEVYIWNRALTPQEIKERFEMYADKVGH